MKKLLLFCAGTLLLSVNASAAERFDAAGYADPDIIPELVQSAKLVNGRHAGVLPYYYFCLLYRVSRSYLNRFGVRYVNSNGTELSRFEAEKVEVRHQGRRLKRDALFKAYAVYLFAHPEFVDSPDLLEEYLALRGNPQQLFTADNPDELGQDFAEFYDDLDCYGKSCLSSVLHGVRFVMAKLGRDVDSFDEFFDGAMCGYHLGDAAAAALVDEPHPHAE